VVLAARKADALQQLAAELGPAAHPFAAHTGKEADCVALVAEAVRKFGKADILVNNAGTNPYFGPLIHAESGAWDKTFEVNLKGYYWTSRELARRSSTATSPASSSTSPACWVSGPSPLAGHLRDDEGSRDLDDANLRRRAGGARASG